MTNYESYADMLKEFFTISLGVSKIDGAILGCNGYDCAECLFCIEGNTRSCVEEKKRWMEEEYAKQQVDWTKVKIDTPIFVRDSYDELWKRRHFAKYEKNKVYAFDKGMTSWSSMNDGVCWKYAELAKVEKE